MKKERINITAQTSFLSYNSYIKEIEKKKETTEKAKTIEDDSVEFPSYKGNKINFLV